MNQNKSVEEVMNDFPCINSQCDGYGNIPHQVSEEEWEAEQCQFCFEYRFPFKELIKQERQTSQEREREIVVDEVIEIIESVQLTATKKYADDTTPDKAKVVNEWLMPEVKRNIIEAVKTLTNPNKD